jgi:hypothetical protein
MKFLKYFISASFIGIIVGVLGIYYTLRSSRTHLSMDIAAESNVLDLKHPIADLAILFQGRDIEEEKSNLKILTVRIINDGEADIHENDFDSRMPFGLQIDGGRVIRAQVAGANSSYLSENLHPRVEGAGRIELDKIIFDKGKFVALEILVLHPKNSVPHVKPVGKIAGIETIAVTNSFQDREQRGFLEQTFSGPVAIQLSRGIGYSLSAVAAIIAIVASGIGLASIPTKLRKMKRKRTVARFPPLDSLERNKKRKALEAIFIENGLEGLLQAQKLLTDQAALKKEMRRSRRFYGGGMASEVTVEQRREVHYRLAFPSTLSPLAAAELLTRKGDNLVVEEDVKAMLAEFIGQLTGEDDQPDPPCA